jgi:NAD(P)-dependent dehydrogenase (short-subunit alcohol dehydrogenase family)
MPTSQNGTTPAVLITGASSGIGAACALHLDQLGWQVFAGVRTEQDAEALQHKASDRLTPLLLDVTDATSITAAVETITAAVGAAGLAGLINNAGVVVVGPLECLPADELQTQFAVNVLGLIAITQAFLPLLRQGKGRIVNMGSLAGKVAFPLWGPYSASKFAVEALTDVLRMELLPWHVTVSLVEPFVIATPLWKKIALRARDNSTENAQRLYGPLLTYIDESMPRTGQSGLPADNVARVVVHALTAKTPKTRYVVTKTSLSLMIRLLRLLPDRMHDRMLRQSLPKYP